MMLLEKQADQRWSNLRVYRAYRDGTPVYLPKNSARITLIYAGLFALGAAKHMLS